MTYDQQIEIIKAAKSGKKILGRRIGSNEDWTYYDPRCSYRNIAIFYKDLQFDFQNFEYKIL